MIYLDNAATTPLDPRVFEEMQPYFLENYGNPGSVHSMGASAKRAVDTAREQVAELICARPEEIVFTSGGTESNNLAVAGMSEFLYINGKKHIAVSAVEHASVRAAAVRVKTLAPDMVVKAIMPEKDGTVSTQGVGDVITNGAGFVSVMCVNNETGAINDVEAIGELCQSNGVYFHTDCVQAAPFMELDVRKIGCDLMSLSSHKLHGPKGVGALYVQSAVPLYTQICGSPQQEFGLRGGTLNVPGIVGFGKACELLKQDLKRRSEYTLRLKQDFYVILKIVLADNGIEGIMHVNGNLPDAPGGILNLRFDGIDGETLLLYLNANGIFASAGSACNAQEQEPSGVLKAMGLTDEEAFQSVRFSFADQDLTVGLTGEAALVTGRAIIELSNNPCCK